MNPFDLRGPEFLFFYLILSGLVIGALMLLRYLSESKGATKIELANPYLIASLRGGNREVLRVALVSLIDRGLLIVNGNDVTRAENVTPDSVRHDIEKELIEKCATPRDISLLVSDQNLLAACYVYEDQLKKHGLLPDESITQQRSLRLLIAAAILGGVAFIKIVIALQRGRTNVAFLVIAVIVACLVAKMLSFPRLTSAGAALLADIQTLYQGLKARATSISPGGATIDAMMLAAVFGVGMLESEAFAYTKKLFPSAQASGSSWSSSTWFTDGSGGSSCSSGSSCGSSCGGGGCGGGCGGCGS